MKIALQDNNQYVLRFDKGEEVMQGLVDFMAANSVAACSFSGIGSASDITLGYFNVFLKEYRQKPFLENLEIISLDGSGAMADGKPAVHAHGMFGRTDFSVVGGHVFKIVVLATCEISLIKLDGTLQRANNPDFNLNLLV